MQWFLERWDATHAILGLIATVAIERAVMKILISVFLSREFKHDETNRAWWTGKWYGRGLGNHVMSQPAREFVVKIVELSLWSSDFLIGHFLLFMLTLPMLFPYADRLHSTSTSIRFILVFRADHLPVVLFWLRPSKQIRAPLYTFKQKKQRRTIVSFLLFPCALAGS